MTDFKYGLDPNGLRERGKISEAAAKELENVLAKEFTLSMDGADFTLMINLLIEFTTHPFVPTVFRDDAQALYYKFQGQKRDQLMDGQLDNFVSDLRDADMGITDVDIESFFEEVDGNDEPPF